MWAWSLKLDLPVFRGWFLLWSNFHTGDRGKPISRKLSITREWDRDIRGQRCLLVQNHVTDFQNSGVVTSGMTSFPVVLVAWQRDRDILGQRLEFAYSHVTNLTKVGVVAQTRSPCVSGVIFAPIEFSHWRQREADFLETINYMQMRPRYTWSAVSACSESRDRFLKFGRGHFR